MQKKQFAVLDVGSGKVTAIVAERGINKTFIIKSRNDFLYDGFVDGALLNVEEFKSVISKATEFISKSILNLDVVYVGVPGAFTEIHVKESQISFAKKKKVTEEDVDLLFDSAFVPTSKKHTLINRSAMSYELNDYRRLPNPVGEVSEILKGKLSFVLCSNYFIELVKSSIKLVSNADVEFVSVALAEAMYLISSEERDRIAILLDVGYISSTFSLIQGDGILFQNSFDYGGGYVTGAITEALDVDFDVAEDLKRNVNLCKIESGNFDLIHGIDGQLYTAETIRRVIIGALDALCEHVLSSIEKSGFVIPEYVPIYVTGGGISYLRGAREHISNRLCSTVYITKPKVPINDKPTDSSVLSVLDLIIG